MLQKMCVVTIVLLTGCMNITTISEPNVDVARGIVITSEQLAGSLTLDKPGTKTINPELYCKVNIKLTGLLPNQLYYVKTTPVLGYSDVADAQGNWAAILYLEKVNVSYLRIYRMNVDYSLTTLSPDYALIEHPNVKLTNRCY